MPWTIDDRFRIPANEAVLAFLERTQPSAHDEVASALFAAAEGSRDLHRYCPDTQAYAWFALHTDEDVIFALALGMSAVLFRLSPDRLEEALCHGGLVTAEIGEGWVQWQIGWDSNLRPWCHSALEFARG